MNELIKNNAFELRPTYPCEFQKQIRLSKNTNKYPIMKDNFLRPCAQPTFINQSLPRRLSRSRSQKRWILDQKKFDRISSKSKSNLKKKRYKKREFEANRINSTPKNKE